MTIKNVSRREMKRIENLSSWTLNLLMRGLELSEKESALTDEETQLKVNVLRTLQLRCYVHDNTDCQICQYSTRDIP